MQFVIFYENIEIYNKIKKIIKADYLVYPITELHKLKNIEIDFIIVENISQNIDALIDKIEMLSATPYIILTLKTDREHYGINLMEMIDYKDINTLNLKINHYLDKFKEDKYSIFELTDIMQVISMERKTLGLRIESGNNVGFIAFENGIPIYSKAIINKKSEYGLEAAFKIITWANLKFNIIKFMGKVPKNIEMDLPNLLMGAMQYKDELEYEALETQKENLKIKENEKGDIDCIEITRNLNKLIGYQGISILKNSIKICDNYSIDSSLKTQNVEEHTQKITVLVTSMLNDMGFLSFEYIVLTTDKVTAIIHHNEEKNSSIILFLSNNSNLALAKVILKKIMLEL